MSNVIVVVFAYTVFTGDESMIGPTLVHGKNLGAVVKAFDTRAVKEQVESLGGSCVTVDVKEDGEGGGYAREFVDAELTLFRKESKDTNVFITTALIAGKPAPKLILILKDMANSMKLGSIIVRKIKIQIQIQIQVQV